MLNVSGMSMAYSNIGMEQIFLGCGTFISSVFAQLRPKFFGTIKQKNN